MRACMELDFMEDFKSYINKYSLPNKKLFVLCAIFKKWVITNTTFFLYIGNYSFLNNSKKQIQVLIEAKFIKLL